MRIAVTGASGNPGTSVLAALSDDPAVEEIIGIARRPPPQRAPKLRWVRADVAADDLVLAFAGADVVIHLAWLIQPSRDPRTTWSTNVLGSARVFQAAADADVFDLQNTPDVTAAVIDAVGMEAHGAPGARVAHQLTALLPDPVAARLMRTAGIDRLAAVYSAIDIVRRGGTISIVGVYGGMTESTVHAQNLR